MSYEIVFIVVLTLHFPRLLTKSNIFSYILGTLIFFFFCDLPLPRCSTESLDFILLMCRRSLDILCILTTCPWTVSWVAHISSRLSLPFGFAPALSTREPATRSLSVTWAKVVARAVGRHGQKLYVQPGGCITSFKIWLK